MLSNIFVHCVSSKAVRPCFRLAPALFRFSQEKKTQQETWVALDEEARQAHLTKLTSLVEKLQQTEKNVLALKQKKAEAIKNHDKLHQEINQARSALEKKIHQCEHVWADAKKKIENIKTENFTSFGKDLIKVSYDFHTIQQNLKETDPEDLAEGVNMTNKILIQNLERHGFKRIEPLNEKFNPAEHVKQAEVEGKADKGTVVEVVRIGWKYGNKTLEPAQVRVSK